MKDMVQGAISVSEHFQRRPNSALVEILDAFDVVLDVILGVFWDFVSCPKSCSEFVSGK